MAQNNTNALSGIFSALGNVASSAASDSASNAYQKTLEINQALKVVEDSRNLKRELKQDAIDDYNQEVRKKTNINAENSSFFTNINNSLIQIAEDVSSTPSDIKNALDNSLKLIEDQDFTPSELQMNSSHINSLYRISNNSIAKKENTGELESVKEALQAVQFNKMRSGNFSNSNEHIEPILKNTTNFLENDLESKNTIEIGNAEAIEGRLNKLAYVAEFLESYDINPKDNFVQFDKKIHSQNEIDIVTIVQNQLKNGLLNDAYTSSLSLYGVKAADRATVSKMYTKAEIAGNKIVKGSISSDQTYLKADFKPIENTEGILPSMNSFDSFEIGDGMSSDYMMAESYNRINNDKAGFVSFIENSEYTEEIKEGMSSLIRGQAAKEYYLAGKIIENPQGKKDGGEFIWNSIPPVDYQIWDNEKKVFRIKNEYQDLSGKWNVHRVQSSQKLLVDKMKKIEGFVSSTSDKEFDVQAPSLMQYFSKFGKLHDFNLKNPNSSQARAVIDRQKSMESIKKGSLDPTEIKSKVNKIVTGLYNENKDIKNFNSDKNAKILKNLLDTIEDPKMRNEIISQLVRERKLR